MNRISRANRANRGHCALTILCAALLLVAATRAACSSAYTIDTTIPLAGGCPAPDRQSLSLAAPLAPRWSTALPTAAPILTVAQPSPKSPAPSRNRSARGPAQRAPHST